VSCGATTDINVAIATSVTKRVVLLRNTHLLLGGLVLRNRTLHIWRGFVS
jgi:hypothetical protein